MAGNTGKPKSVSPNRAVLRERRITVAAIPYERKSEQSGRGPPRTLVPWIRMQGQWLEQAGFETRTRVRVRVMQGCLVLTVE